MPQEICELIDFHVDTFPLQKVSKYEWYGSGMGVVGSGMGVVWEWYGSGMGVVWEWYGSGMGVVWECFGNLIPKKTMFVVFY